MVKQSVPSDVELKAALISLDYLIRQYEEAALLVARQAVIVRALERAS